MLKSNQVSIFILQVMGGIIVVNLIKTIK